MTKETVLTGGDRLSGLLDGDEGAWQRSAAVGDGDGSLDRAG